LITKAECEESTASPEDADKLLVAATAKVDEKQPLAEAADMDDLVFCTALISNNKPYWLRCCFKCSFKC